MYHYTEIAKQVLHQLQRREYSVTEHGTEMTIEVLINLKVQEFSLHILTAITAGVSCLPGPQILSPRNVAIALHALLFGPGSS